MGHHLRQPPCPVAPLPKPASASTTTTPATSEGGGGGDGAYPGRSPLYQCATHSPPPPSLVHSGNLMVHRNYQLADDYSAKVHCYIAQPGNSDAAPGDHMPSAVLPSFGTLSSPRDLPFWRPPPVLEREPHYNQFGPPAQQPQQQQHRAPAGHISRHACPASADTSAGPSLSPALLAITNSHYHQQRDQPVVATLPAIQSLLPPLPPLSGDGRACSVTPHVDSARRAGDNSASASASDSDPEAGGHEGAAASAGAATHTRHPHHKLPALSAHARDASDAPCTLLRAASPTAGAACAREPMSIASLVGASAGGAPHTVALPGISSLAPPTGGRKRLHSEESAAAALHKMARTAAVARVPGRQGLPRRTAALPPPDIHRHPLCAPNQVVITCYHAAVAQKSYGGEKRFLCPPPAVLMHGEGHSARVAHHSPMLISVVTDANEPGRPGASCLPKQGGGAPAADADAGSARPSTSSHAPLECQTSFNERNVALFKSLHVTGVQKAKSFRLRLDLLTPPGPSQQLCGQGHMPWQASDVYASLTSGPVAIISKPSKKTAKARNQSSCIREGSLISLFNRINSQTFRTKHLNVDHKTSRLVAQSHNWTPLEVVVVASPVAASVPASRAGDSSVQNGAAFCRGPLYYGSEIVLAVPRCNYRSPPMVIHKVERGRLVDNACSPVSQMQKIALQLKPVPGDSASRYLKADVGNYSPPSSDGSPAVHLDDTDNSPELTFEELDSARTPQAHPGVQLTDTTGTAIDDAFCWTIVNISQFTYAFALPVKPSSVICRACPDPLAPQVPHASHSSGSSVVELTMRGFDAAHMCVLLGGAPLKIESRGAVVPPRQQHAGSGGASSATGPEERYLAHLPAGARPGTLSIQRSDGVLYHTKWAVRQSAAAADALELVACEMDL